MGAIITAFAGFLGGSITAVLGWIGALVTREALVKFFRLAGRLTFAAALALLVVNLAVPYLQNVVDLVPDGAWWIAYQFALDEQLPITITILIMLLALSLLKRMV